MASMTVRPVISGSLTRSRSTMAGAGALDGVPALGGDGRSAVQRGTGGVHHAAQQGVAHRHPDDFAGARAPGCRRRPRPAAEQHAADPRSLTSAPGRAVPSSNSSSSSRRVQGRPETVATPSPTWSTRPMCSRPGSGAQRRGAAGGRRQPAFQILTQRGHRSPAAPALCAAAPSRSSAARRGETCSSAPPTSVRVGDEPGATADGRGRRQPLGPTAALAPRRAASAVATVRPAAAAGDVVLQTFPFQLRQRGRSARQPPEEYVVGRRRIIRATAPPPAPPPESATCPRMSARAAARSAARLARAWSSSSSGLAARAVQDLLALGVHLLVHAVAQGLVLVLRASRAAASSCMARLLRLLLALGRLLERLLGELPALLDHGSRRPIEKARQQPHQDQEVDRLQASVHQSICMVGPGYPTNGLA